jgi:glutamate synthase (NADPH/NADH) small chain
LEKGLLERRVALLKKEGVRFETGAAVGTNLPARKLKEDFDALCLACGSRQPRDLLLEGRGLKGICFAMDYLIQSNRRVAGERFPQEALIDAKGKKVVVIGGGDTGADCVGVAHRQGASCVVQIEIMPRPSKDRPSSCPWPGYPMLLKTSTSHEEGGSREWSVLTKRFIAEMGRVGKLSCVRVEFSKDASGCMKMKEVPGSQFEIEADLVVLALGFLHPEKKGLIEELSLRLDVKGNVATDPQFMTSQKGIFACGDMRRGQSLIVWAISEGRRCAYHIDKYLMGESRLPLL